MSLLDVTVIAFGLFAGYWIVAKLFFRAPPKPVPPPPEVPRSTEPAWHEVLGVPPDADLDGIRQAYHRLISQYHPDKVASLGQELKDLAERKSQLINAAYDRALSVRGAPR